MGKFLRVLVVIIFLLTIASLTLATLLFTKREMLKGRTNELEKGIESISKVLEAEPPETPEDPVVYPARDTSDCTSEILDSPEKSDFWNKYKQKLEEIDRSFMDLSKRRDELSSYYKLDMDGKPARDSRNLKITKGKGTTQGVIDDVVAHATAQLDLLTETRQQLIDIRIELVDTINELNGRKKTLREKLSAIVDLNNKITELNKTINDLNSKNAEQAETISSLESDVKVLQQEKRANLEEIEGLKIAKEELKNRIVELRKITDKNGNGDGSGKGITHIEGFATIKIPPGLKGTVASVDQKHQFVVIKVKPSFVNELIKSTTKEGYIPFVVLIIKRGEDQFISKVRIKQLKKEDNLIIGEILLDWQQGPIHVGDTVFYQ